MFDRISDSVNEDSLRINLERNKQENDDRLIPVEKSLRDLVIKFDNIKYEVDNKISERLNKMGSAKVDNASEILQLKNDLYSFIDNKLTHHSTIVEKRVETIHNFCNENDLRLKKLINYKDEIEMKVEEQTSSVNNKVHYMAQLEDRLETAIIESRRTNNDVLAKVKNFEHMQEAMRQELDSQMQLLKSQKYQENELKQLVLTVLAPRDKIERENIKKYNKLFRSLESKINSLLNHQQKAKQQTETNTVAIQDLESKILATFERQIDEMKRINNSPSKRLSSDERTEKKMKEIEQRIDEKSMQTITLFDSAREDIETNKSNLENLAKLYYSITDQVKKIHKLVGTNDAEYKKKMVKTEASFVGGFQEVKTICLDKLDAIDQKLKSQQDENQKIRDEIKALEQRMSQAQPSPNKGILETISRHRAAHQKTKSHQVDQNGSKIMNKEIENKFQSEDGEEILFDANDQEFREESYRKSKHTTVKSNYNVVDNLPEIASDELDIKDEDDNDPLDISSSVEQEENLSQNERKTEELRPLPSPTPPLDQKQGNKENSKSIEQIKLESKSSPPPVTTQIVKPSYNFLSTTGGGLSRPSAPKPKTDFPRMKRDEFKVNSPKYKPQKEGDYFYSLKENQYAISSQIMPKEMLNSIRISQNERKQGIYTEKYNRNQE